MLNRYGVQYNREESEKVDSLRYSVQKLFSQSVRSFFFKFGSRLKGSPYSHYFVLKPVYV